MLAFISGGVADNSPIAQSGNACSYLVKLHTLSSPVALPDEHLGGFNADKGLNV